MGDQDHCGGCWLVWHKCTLYITVQYCTVQYSMVRGFHLLYNALHKVLHCMVQLMSCNTSILYSKVQYSTVQYSTMSGITSILYSKVQYSTVQCVALLQYS